MSTCYKHYTDKLTIFEAGLKNTAFLLPHLWLIVLQRVVCSGNKLALHVLLARYLRGDPVGESRTLAQHHILFVDLSIDLAAFNVSNPAEHFLLCLVCALWCYLDIQR